MNPIDPDDLNAFWDSVVHGNAASDITSIEEATVRQIHALRPAPPAERFRHQLFHDLMSDTATMPATRLVATQSRHPWKSLWRDTRFDRSTHRGYQIVAAMLAIFLVAGIMASWFTERKDSSPATATVRAAAVAASPIIRDCSVPPRDMDELSRLTGTPPTSLAPAATSMPTGEILFDQLPVGITGIPGDAAGVRAAMDMWRACTDAFARENLSETESEELLARLYGLYSENYFRRVTPREDGTYPIVIVSTRSGEPAVERVWRLQDGSGRVAALVRPADPKDSPLLVVFLPASDLWLIDEIVRVRDDVDIAATPNPVTVADWSRVFCGERYATWGGATVEGVTLEVISVSVGVIADFNNGHRSYPIVTMMVQNDTDVPVSIKPEQFAFVSCSEPGTPATGTTTTPSVNTYLSPTAPMVVPPHTDQRVQMTGVEFTPETMRIAGISFTVTIADQPAGTITCPLVDPALPPGSRDGIGCSATGADTST